MSSSCNSSRRKRVEAAIGKAEVHVATAAAITKAAAADSIDAEVAAAIGRAMNLFMSSELFGPENRSSRIPGLVAQKK